MSKYFHIREEYIAEIIMNKGMDSDYVCTYAHKHTKGELNNTHACYTLIHHFHSVVQQKKK